jgi:aminoglycoside 2'-N-acetyltransferase I
MVDELALAVKKKQDISENEYTDISDLCSRAYGREDFRHLLETFKDTTHVLGRYQQQLVSHALWITRWLQYPGLPPWRTAYVEAVATDEQYRNRGFATQVMKRIAEEIVDNDIGGLCTGTSIGLYSRSGWKLWRGPLSIRTEDGMMATPEEKGVMVLELLKTPNIDLDMPLSAEWREGELW